MEEKKLTDEEIVKALEHCFHNRSCEYCYHNAEVGSGEIVCRSRLMRKALDLIHRLQSENERLSFIASVVSKGVAVEIVNMQNTIDEQKAEIETLTEENGILKGNPPMIAGRSFGKTIREKLLTFDKMKERNAELQKQVEAWKARAKELETAWEISSSNEEKLQKNLDELKELNEKYLDSIESVQAGRCRFRCELTEQAVKDTAKEIYLLMVGEYECYIPTEIAKEIVLRYGVEVE